MNINKNNYDELYKLKDLAYGDGLGQYNKGLSEALAAYRKADRYCKDKKLQLAAILSIASKTDSTSVMTLANEMAAAIYKGFPELNREIEVEIDFSASED
jgi:hypothetical protein